MGQILGFSHCQEYGSVASTPDSTPPCTDGGNEESEMYELQTAREWSEDEDGDGEPDDDEGLASSPSVWGTPRQNSFELTFSYIAIAEAEAVGASRGQRRRGAPRGGRGHLVHTDTLETLSDFPDSEWDPQGYLSQEEEESSEREVERTAPGEEEGQVELYAQSETIATRPPPRSLQPETQEGEAGIQREESGPSQAAGPPSPSSLQASPASESDSPVAGETAPVKLLTAVPPGSPSSAAEAAAAGLNSQEQLVGEQWFSPVRLPEDLRACIHSAVMDLIYWKDTERTGMVLTGLVVSLLCLFQLSIITVLSTASLAVVCFTMSVRIYYKVLHILNWGDGEHPFKSYLDLDIGLSGEHADLYMQRAIVMTLSAVDGLKRLIFVGSLFSSLKFLLLMYLVTFLGDLCNGLTLLIIGVIALFSLPLFYSRYQEQVDGFFAKIQAHVDNVKDILQRLARGGGPAPDTTPGGAKPKTQ